MGAVEAVWEHPPGAGGGWTRTPVPSGLDVGEAEVAALGDRLLLSGERAAVRDGDEWRRLRLPEPDARVEVAGDKLWALGFRSNGLWVSDDLGRSWQAVEP